MKAVALTDPLQKKVYDNTNWLQFMHVTNSIHWNISKKKEDNYVTNVLLNYEIKSYLISYFIDLKKQSKSNDEISGCIDIFMKYDRCFLSSLCLPP